MVPRGIREKGEGGPTVHNMWMRLKRKLKDRWNFGGKEDRENQKK